MAQLEIARLLGSIGRRIQERFDSSLLSRSATQRRARRIDCRYTIVCWACSAGKSRESQKVQQATKCLKGLVGAPGLDPGTR
jgi:hypothetical protein